MAFKKGAMRPVKKVIGVLLLIYGVIGLFRLNYAIPIIGSTMLRDLAMLAGGYFLFISGRRK